jgi:sugar-specific transcriptional regulator TrmB
MFEETFRKLGLKKNEARTYEVLLDLGKGTAGEILKKLPLKRSTLYNALYDLVKKGLVRQNEKGKKIVFEAKDPENLRALQRERKEKLKLANKELKNILPSLKSRYNLSVGRPTVRYFEGREGLKEIYKDTLKEKPKEILVFRSIYDDESFNKYLNKYYVPKRADLGIKTRIISPAVPTKEKLEEDKKLLKKRKHIDKKDYSLPTEINIYGDKVALLSHKRKKIGLIIENKDLAETFNIIFDNLWQKL